MAHVLLVDRIQRGLFEREGDFNEAFGGSGQELLLLMNKEKDYGNEYFINSTE